MFDASAYELAEPPEQVSANRAAPEAVEASGPAGANALDVALAACSLCTQAFGGCAIGGARAGLVSPVLALSVCGWMQRAAHRAVRFDGGARNRYVAYVLFGNGRTQAQREADILALGETMR
ncbi:MAG: hypothetical protein MUD06_04790 [Rhodospirillales bacterium]|jgi:hypothetical protein|nr:hypothetical protein [Rhodospirillales bacterium]